MDSDLVLEIVGYVASGLIIVSITQKSILKLRVIGLVGAIAFLIYSIGIEAYPIAVVNVMAAGIHAWYLRKLICRKEETFRVLHVLPESKYLQDFIEFYGSEIQGRFQPEFVYSPNPEQTAVFVLRDMVPAGLFIGEHAADGSFQVKLDFVIPQYRDFKIGKYVYAHGSDVWASSEPTCVWAEASSDDHAKYLRRMGFVQRAAQPGTYEVAL